MKKNTIYTDSYTHAGVQRFIIWILDTQGIGQFELSKRAQMSQATLWQIQNKSPKTVTRPPRKTTLAVLAASLGAEVRFDTEVSQFSIVQTSIPQTESNDLNLLLSDIARALTNSGKTRFSVEERERIVRVVKAVI